MIRASWSQVGWMLAFVSAHAIVALPLYWFAVRHDRTARPGKEGGP